MPLFTKYRVIAPAITILILFSLPQLTQAHGEDKPGPHGGHIRMPGAFHTELVLMGKRKAKIYLLDINWKNPSPKGKVKASLGKVAATCAARDNLYFACDFPEGSNLSAEGTLFIQAERGEQKGIEISYELPLPAHTSDSHLDH